MSINLIHHLSSYGTQIYTNIGHLTLHQPPNICNKFYAKFTFKLKLYVITLTRGMSFHVMVILFWWIAARLASLNTSVRKTSDAYWSVMRAVPRKCKVFFLKSYATSLTRLQYKFMYMYTSKIGHPICSFYVQSNQCQLPNILKCKCFIVSSGSLWMRSIHLFWKYLISLSALVGFALFLAAAHSLAVDSSMGARKF